MLERYLKPAVAEALPTKMVFIGGPRQVGKTTLALSLIAPGATERHPAYLNWDDPKMRPALRGGELPPREPVGVLDENLYVCFRISPYGSSGFRDGSSNVAAGTYTAVRQ